MQDRTPELSDKAKALIRRLVDDMASENFAEIVADGRIGYVTAEDLARVISEYGRTLLPLPEQAFELVDVFAINGSNDQFAVDVPLWTKEEGRSDLTLFVRVVDDPVSPTVAIEDLRVP